VDENREAGGQDDEGQKWLVRGGQLRPEVPPGLIVDELDAANRASRHGYEPPVGPQPVPAKPVAASTGQDQVSAWPQCSWLVLEGRLSSIRPCEVEMPAEPPGPSADVHTPLLGGRPQRRASFKPLEGAHRLSGLREHPELAAAAGQGLVQVERHGSGGVDLLQLPPRPALRRSLAVGLHNAASDLPGNPTVGAPAGRVKWCRYRGLARVDDRTAGGSVARSDHTHSRTAEWVALEQILVCNWDDGWHTGWKPMERLSVRLTDKMFWQLDALAEERGITRTRLVRQLLEAGLHNRPEPPSETPSEAELLAVLSEKARAGNVAAARTLLAREEQKDPRRAALALFEDMAARRQ
jgi:Ribbon-helix-helix protein, copG family